MLGLIAAITASWAGIMPAEYHDMRLVEAIIQVESAGKDDAVGDNGKAVGCLQIHPEMVEDVNRIIGADLYNLEDRKDRDQSIQMFCIYTQHYSKGCSDEVKARRWNGGPKGDNKSSTIEYWRKVQQKLE